MESRIVTLVLSIAITLVTGLIISNYFNSTAPQEQEVVVNPCGEDLNKIY